MLAVWLLTATAVSAAPWPRSTNASFTNSSVSSTLCGGKSYVYQQLAGYGNVSSFARDKFGDTIGGIGSAIALDLDVWAQDPHDKNRYTGVLWTLPDRGWNTEGTLNYIPRIHKFGMELDVTLQNSSAPNLHFTYLDTVRLGGPDGKPLTGLDADGSGHLSYAGFPDLPVASYTGDGYGGVCRNGNTTSQRVSLDAEGLVRNADGSFWVSDEYGPYIYRFSATGQMLSAIRPPEAFIPKRNGSDSFSADSPFHYINNGTGDDVWPADNPTGRNNNHGFEGLSASADGNTLYAFLQAATNQEGGTGKQTERWTRLLKYDVTIPDSPALLAEYVVGLPLFDDPTRKASKNPVVAAQSEIHVLPNGHVFVLARDSDVGRGQHVTESQYRHIDIIDLADASDIHGDTYDCADCAVADDDGVLDAAITNATLCPFLDFNNNVELARFGLHNGGDQDDHLLNEKWESIALAPVHPGVDDGSYFLFSLSDNDFITQDGYLEDGRFQYADGSGYSLDTQALVFQISVPS